MNLAKSEWQALKEMPEVKFNPKSMIEAKQELAKRLAAKGVQYLVRRESKVRGYKDGAPTGYSWVEHGHAWKLSMKWNGRVVYFGMLKDENHAQEAGAALLALRTKLSKTADFKCVVRAAAADPLPPCRVRR